MVDIPKDGWVDAPTSTIPGGGWEDAPAEPGQGRLLGNRGQDDPYGAEKNLGTSVVKGGLGLAGGMLGDIGSALDLVRTGGMQLFGDKRSHAEIMKAEDDAREEKAKAMVARRRKHLGLAPLDTENTPGPFGGRYQAPGVPTTQDLYDAAVKPTLGEYVPQTPEGRIGSFAVQAATPGLGFSKFGTQGPRIVAGAPGVVESAMTAARNVKPALIGGASGVAGGAAEEKFHNPYITLGATLATPIAAETGLGAGQKFLPKSREQNARTAGKQYADDIRAAGEDPAAVLKTAEETYRNQPGWHTDETQPTIGEAGKSRALAQGELAAGMTDLGTDAQLVERGKARNQARKGAMQDTVDPLATGEEPGQKFRQYLDDLDQQVEKALPEGGTAEEIGATARKALEEGRTAAEEARTKLYDEVENRFGDQKLLVPGLKEAAKDLTKHKPGFTKKRAPDEHTQMAIDMPDEVSFGDLRAYLKDINLEISQARGNPNKTAELGQLKRLKGGVMDDMQNAVANWATKDAEATASGNPVSGGKFADMLQRQRDEFYAARAVGEGGGGPGGSQSAGAVGVPGGGQAATGAGPQRGGASAPGNAGAVPGGSERLSPEATKALKAANDAQTYLGETYRQGAPGQLLKENGFKGNWNIADSKVPRTAFPGGPDGYTITKSVLEGGAGRPEMVQALKDTAIMSLRDAMDEGGQLSPKALAAWQKKYATSLRALDEVSPGFKNQFDNLANTQSALASKFVGAADAREAANFMGNILRKPDGASQLRHLVQEAGGEPGVIEGFKKLIIDHMANEADQRTGGSGEWGLHMRAQLARYSNVMKEVFGPDHMKVMDQLAQDIADQQSHLSNMKPGAPGSPTAHRTQLLKQRLTEPTERHSPDLGVLGPLEFMREGVGAGIKAFMVAKGMGMINHLAHTMKVRGIRGVNEMYRAGMTDPQLGVRMLRHGLEAPGADTWAHRVAEGLSQSPLYTQPGIAEDEKRRRHASGGRVGELAGHLMKAVDQARKLNTAKTEPLLHQDDTMVANALAIAGKHI